MISSYRTISANTACEVVATGTVNADTTSDIFIRNPSTRQVIVHFHTTTGPVSGYKTICTNADPNTPGEKLFLVQNHIFG